MKVKVLLVFAIFTLTSFIKAQDTTPTFMLDRPYIQKQVNCVLNWTECDSLGRKIIALLPEALNNNCERCTLRQATLAHRLIAFMQQNYPNEWQTIISRYGTVKHFT